jgi:hypothetical protein
VRIVDYPQPGGALTVADGGRVILGEERFRVRAERGRELVVVLRSHPRAEGRALGARGGRVAALEIPRAGLVVQAEGRTVARLELPNTPGWNEHVFRVPGDALGDGATQLRLSGRYTSFQYWFFQARR